MSGSTFEGTVERMYVAGVRGSPLALMSSTWSPGESTPQVEAQAVVGYTAYGRAREGSVQTYVQFPGRLRWSWHEGDDV